MLDRSGVLRGQQPDGERPFDPPVGQLRLHHGGHGRVRREQPFPYRQAELRMAGYDLDRGRHLFRAGQWLLPGLLDPGPPGVVERTGHQDRPVVGVVVERRAEPVRQRRLVGLLRRRQQLGREEAVVGTGQVLQYRGVPGHLAGERFHPFWGETERLRLDAQFLVRRVFWNVLGHRASP
jgi:hypothetical protein